MQSRITFDAKLKTLLPAHLNSCYGAVHNVTGPEVSPKSDKTKIEME